MSKKPHIPILADEWITFLKETTLNTYVDATVGAGGHAKAVLEHFPDIKTFIAIDQDPSALKLAKQSLAEWKDKTTFVHDNFLHLNRILDSLSIQSIDALLFDLGVSSMQLDQGIRGFSFMQPGPLDMRMNPDERLTAKEIVNTWPEEELGRIFRDYGEEKNWRRASKAIVKARKEHLIETTKELVEIVSPALKTRKKNIHPATLVFQALRICVNSELEVLQNVLPAAIDRLKSGGILGIITFHSLEDRIVKNFFKKEASNKQDTSGLAGLFLEKIPTIKLVTRKPVSPGENEINANPRSRSAKLRVVRKQ